MPARNEYPEPSQTLVEVVAPFGVHIDPYVPQIHPEWIYEDFGDQVDRLTRDWPGFQNETFIAGDGVVKVTRKERMLQDELVGNSAFGGGIERGVYIGGVITGSQFGETLFSSPMSYAMLLETYEAPQTDADDVKPPITAHVRHIYTEPIDRTRKLLQIDPNGWLLQAGREHDRNLRRTSGANRQVDPLFDIATDVLDTLDPSMRERRPSILSMMRNVLQSIKQPRA